MVRKENSFNKIGWVLTIIIGPLSIIGLIAGIVKWRNPLEATLTTLLLLIIGSSSLYFTITIGLNEMSKKRKNEIELKLLESQIERKRLQKELEILEKELNEK